MNVAWTRAAEGYPRRAFTVDDVRRMIEIGVIKEDERIELIEGELVVMAAKGYAHELVRQALAELLTDARPEGTRVTSELTLQLDKDVIVEPDIAVFPRSSFTKAESGFSRLPEGSILLVVEIAVSSLRHDKSLKAGLYARHGARELWVIDASERIAWVHTGPTAQGWSSVVEVGPDEALTTPAVPGLVVKLAELE
jgi:Uma2 family endonuclease